MDGPSPPRSLLRFLTELDAKRARALWVSALLVTLAGAVLALGMAFVNVDQGVLAGALRGLRGAWWAPFAVTGVFVVLAFIGAPQIALIAATVAVFGPIEGAVLSWISTMVSALVGYYAGRVAGADAIKNLGGPLMADLSAKVTQNGVLAALVIRLVPAAPFIVVNMALGASGVRTGAFILGSGLGIAPKILLLAFAGHGVSQLFAKETMTALGGLAGAGAIWLAITYVVAPRLRQRL